VSEENSVKMDLGNVGYEGTNLPSPVLGVYIDSDELLDSAITEHFLTVAYPSAGQ
jgi:hypothetical protein